MAVLHLLARHPKQSKHVVAEAALNLSSRPLKKVDKAVTRALSFGTSRGAVVVSANNLTNQAACPCRIGLLTPDTLHLREAMQIQKLVAQVGTNRGECKGKGDLHGS